ncbi:MAG: hypothetical protein UT84_C0005G0035 [Candidatus Curtissbacteria bacterium GW2011_GWA1_40_16]|uniref:Uncharacterized protein n=1 Tax=Candidatus Curtissbacteria bacterium GW2011_GWA1_40_16 TaxID=1618405 RepID=A0A0G0RDU9_9BACT|nr:MAG: hypothetical protein UT84_C0005G0035 [Candidatus Curtissbacteria bacterium GW2011_GWA1_40_16]
MIKKILILTFLLFGFMLFKGYVSKPIYAADQAIIMVPLDNTAGSIDITVTVHFYDNFGEILGSPVRQTVTRWTSYSLYSPISSTNSPPYTLDWSTDCTDPPVKTTYAGTWGDGVGPSIAAYEADTQDVHCQTPNARPYITNTACANFGWGLTGVGENGENIARFDIYMSQTESQIGPGDPTIGPVDSVGPGSRSYNFGASGKSGRYYVRVRAVSPQWVAGESGAAGSWSSVGSFFCGSEIIAASPSGVYTNCNGTGAGATVTGGFGWTPASGGTGFTEQWLDNSVANNNFVPSAYMQSANVGVGASSYVTGTTVNGTRIDHMAQGTRYYWRINTQADDDNWYPSVTASFVTPTCPDVTEPTPAPTDTPVPGTCSDPACTLPTHDVQWGRPTGRGAALPPTPAKTCSSSELSCTISGLDPTIWWSAWYGAVESGTKIGEGGPAGTFWGGYTVSWNWKWIVFYCPVPDDTYTSCVGNPDSKYTAKFNDNGSGPSNIITKTLDNLSPDQYYAWQANVIDLDDGVGDEYTRGNFNSGACDCPATPEPTATPPPPRITLSGFSDCVDGLNPLVHLTWTSNTGNTGYGVFKDNLTNNVTSTGLPSSLGSSSRSWNSTSATGLSPGVAYSWYVRGTGGSFGTVTSNGGVALSITTATCIPPPADPSNLVITSSCNAATGLPEITFRWQDNSNIEQGFWMDVSHDAFTGPSSTTVSPSVWGVKGITRSGADVGGTGGTVQFIWRGAPPPPPPPTSNTDGALDSGNANTTGNLLVPDRGVTYYWRVKAYSADRQSNHVYPGGADGVDDADTIPDGSITPPGVSFTTPTCYFDLQVTNNPPPGNTQVYEPGTTATFKVQVTNTTAAQVAYPGGAGVLGAWTTSNAPALGCTGTSVTPTDPGDHTIQSIQISSTPIAVGSSVIITLTGFTVPTAPGSYIATFYALPNCTPNNESPLTWSNNIFQLTYVVSAKAWFRTSGGDVGARGTIDVSNNAVPIYSQSSYVLALITTTKPFSRRTVVGFIATLPAGSGIRRQLTIVQFHLLI